MTKISTVFLAFLLSYSAIGQNIELGAGSNVSSIYSPTPINNYYYPYSHYQVIYTRAEINAKGVFNPDSLFKFGFYIENPPSYSLMNYTIGMKHTNDSVLGGTYDGGPFKQVLAMPSYTPQWGKFDLLTLDSAFLWNGTQNILVDICSPPGALNTLDHLSE